jgi:hypothetical protein
MTHLRANFGRSALPLLLVLCLAALTATSVYAGGQARPLAATDLLGSPDAAVNGKFAVGSASVGTKALTVTGVIDFLGAGTVHNYFTQGGGNNMQINTNVDEANTVGDASRSQWKVVLGSNLDQFSIRRSPAGATYDEDALLWIDGSTGNVGIATVDTGNGASIPFTPLARLHVQTTSGHAVMGITTATSGGLYGVFGASTSPSGSGVAGLASAASGTTYGMIGQANSASGSGVYGWASASTGVANGVYGKSDSTSGRGVYGYVDSTTGSNTGVFGESDSTDGSGVNGYATATTGTTYGVRGSSASTSGRGVYGGAGATTGTNYGVYGVTSSTSGIGVYGLASANSGTNYGVFGVTISPSGTAVFGYANTSVGTNYGVYGQAGSSSGYGVYSNGNMYADGNFTATGTKSAIVDTKDFGWRTLYAMESPQNWFEDFGQATLVDGEATVSLEPIFLQTVSLDGGYHVFLTPLGECALYVADKSRSSFIVRALEGNGCEISFDYRIIAQRLEYEDLRLEPAQDPDKVAASVPSTP